MSFLIIFELSLVGSAVVGAEACTPFHFRVFVGNGELGARTVCSILLEMYALGSMSVNSISIFSFNSRER